MVQFVTDIASVRYSDVMALYATDLQEAARRDYPHLPAAVGLMEAEQDFYAYLKDVFFQTEGAVFALWTEKGNYISALRLEPYEDGLLLCGIITAEGYRRQGYAKRLVEETLKSLPAHTKIYSHVAQDNIASLSFHAACGFLSTQGAVKMLNGELLHNFLGFLRVV